MSPSTGSSDRQFLLDWLRAAQGRRTWMRRLHHLGWVMTVLLAAAAVYLGLRAAGAPEPVLAGLAPLLLLCAIAAAVAVGWRGLLVPSIDLVVREADARGRLNDALRSAHWFSVQGAEGRSAWESLAVHRAVRALRGLEPARLFPVRLPASVRVAAGVAVIAFAIGVTKPGAQGVMARMGAIAAASSTPQPAASRGSGGAKDAGSEAAAVSSLNGRAAGGGASEAKVSAAGPSSRADGDPDASGMPAGAPPRGAADIAAVSDSRTPRSVSAVDSLKDAAGVAADVAHGVLDRLKSMLGPDRTATASDESALQVAGDGAKAARDAKEDTQSRDADQHMTMDALSEALRALSQAPTGDSPMPNSGPGDGGGNQGRTNIQGGAMGMRLNTSQAGEGGGDEPPDAPGDDVGESVLGKATRRLAARVQKLDSPEPSGAERSSGSDGFYAATQAQAARLGLAQAPRARGSAGEAVLARQHVPLAYREAVKRFSLAEHGKEH